MVGNICNYLPHSCDRHWFYLSVSSQCQYITSAQYFQSRLSTTTYSQEDDAKPTRISGASNPDLLKRLQADIGK
ncbi:potassium-transporting ATPase subunit C [Aliterella atlantica]|uniref:hypothetical protein n=1 Tax=Aliterella atlantica TaxID=1827278 RepID=UPI000697FEE5|nr:hypothetical protein [Aliterella atlantica]